MDVEVSDGPVTEAEEEEFMPANEAAYNLGVTRERVVRLLMRRRLEGRYDGGRWYVKRRAVEKLQAKLGKKGGAGARFD